MTPCSSLNERLSPIHSLIMAHTGRHRTLHETILPAAIRDCPPWVITGHCDTLGWQVHFTFVNAIALPHQKSDAMLGRSQREICFGWEVRANPDARRMAARSEDQCHAANDG
jgi:hypothetical protein